MRIAGWTAVICGASGIAIVTGACVGDDPPGGAVPNPTTSDGGGNVDGDAPDGTPSPGDAAGATDAADAAAPRCDLTKPFGPLEQILELSDPGNKDDRSPALSEDENRVFFVSNRAGPDRIYFAERGADGKFDSPTLAQVAVDAGTAAGQYVDRVSITADEKTMYFSYSRTGNQDFEVWVAQRTVTTAPPVFSAAQLVSGISEPESVGSPFVNAGGTRLYYAAESAAGSNLFQLHSVECTAPAECGTRRSFPDISTSVPFGDGMPVLDRSETTMYFASPRDGGVGQNAVYVTTRSAATKGFTSAELAISARPKVVQPSWLSADGCRLYLDGNQNGTFDIYVTSRP